MTQKPEMFYESEIMCFHCESYHDLSCVEWKKPAVTGCTDFINSANNLLKFDNYGGNQIRTLWSKLESIKDSITYNPKNSTQTNLMVKVNDTIKTIKEFSELKDKSEKEPERISEKVLESLKYHFSGNNRPQSAVIRYLRGKGYSFIAIKYLLNSYHSIDFMKENETSWTEFKFFEDTLEVKTDY